MPSAFLLGHAVYIFAWFDARNGLMCPLLLDYDYDSDFEGDGVRERLT
jgi:hypothetical protein